jgi:hypothetical protein
MISKRIFFLLSVTCLLFISGGCADLAKEIQPPRELFAPRVQSTAGNRCDVLLNDASVDVSKDEPPVIILKLSGELTSACSNLQLGIKPPTEDKVIEVILGNSTIQGEQGGGGSKPFTIGYPLVGLVKGDYTVTVSYAAYNAEQKKKLNFIVP